MSAPSDLGAVAASWPPASLAGAAPRRAAAVALLLAYLALLLLLVSGRLRISTVGLALYAAAVTAMIVTLYIGKDWFSPFSFWYLIVLYFVYVFSAETTLAEYLG